MNAPAPAAFRYRVARPDGVIEEGILRAIDREAAAATLARKGWFIVEMTRRPSTMKGLRRVSPGDIGSGLRALASLLKAGLPLDKALETLDGVAPRSWAPVLPELRARVQQGERLADSLVATGLPIPRDAVGVMYAGEMGSGLAAATESAARLLEARAETRTAVRNALAYPTILLVAGCASLGLLVGVVLPRFVDLFGETGQSLPLSTRLVLGLSSVGGTALVLAAVLSLLLVATHRYWVTRPDGSRQWHELLRRIPALGSLRAVSASAAASSALAALLDAGIPLAAALPGAAAAAGDEATATRLGRVRRRLVSGEALSSALEAEEALSETAVRFVRAGEETGDLAEMLSHAASVDRMHVGLRLRRLTSLIEPTLVLLFGGVILLVAMALLQSMYGLHTVP